jgi:signal transduction histidine kinase
MARTPWSRITKLLGLVAVASQPLEMPDEQAFEEHARDLSTRNTRLAALFIAGVSLYSFGTDHVIFGDPDVVHRLTAMRLGHVAAGLAGYLALLPAPLARRPLIVGLGMAIVCCVLLGYVTGLLGDLDAPWFHFTYAVYITMLVPVVGLGWRVLCGAALPVSLLAGFALARPLVPVQPMLWPTLAFLVFMTAAGVAVGDFVYRLVRRDFLHVRAQHKLSLELGELNATLKDRVRAQTRELRMLATHLENAREDERTRIARDLHDELGQELTAMRYTLTFLRQRFERDPAAIRSNLDELDALLGRTAATTRQILADLRPRIIDDLGLEAGLSWLVDRTAERTGLACRFTAPPRRMDLDLNVAIAAFRIVQESITNVVRHANACRVEVEIVMEERDFWLIVRDDGIGLREPPASGARCGMGLIGIRERAAALGGEMRLERAPEGGTVVRVRLPIQGPRAIVQEAA